MATDEVADARPPLTTGEIPNEKPALHQDPNGSSSTISIGDERKFARIRDNGYARSFWRIVTWTPKRCRWDPESPPQFSMGLNVLFAFVSAANVSRVQPMFLVLACHGGAR